MDALMGLALFGAGMTAGGGLIVSYYKSLKGVQDSERRIAARKVRVTMAPGLSALVQ